jgi:hypothetical protein
VASLAEESEKTKKAQQQTEKAQQEMARESERLQQEMKKEMKRLLKVHEETSKTVGRLGNSLGQFTEGLVYPSIEKILYRRFNVDFVDQRTRRRRNGTELELDAYGFSIGERPQVYIVEIKTKFGEDRFQQFLNTLAAFPKFFPEHADKQVYGIVAAVTMPDAIRQRLLKAGIYVATIHDDVCTLRIPRGFKPRAFHSGRRP